MDSFLFPLTPRSSLSLSLSYSVLSNDDDDHVALLPVRFVISAYGYGMHESNREEIDFGNDGTSLITKVVVSR